LIDSDFDLEEEDSDGGEYTWHNAASDESSSTSDWSNDSSNERNYSEYDTDEDIEQTLLEHHQERAIEVLEINACFCNEIPFLEKESFNDCV